MCGGVIMADDYVSAAKRHRADAATLAAAGRFDNAGHLVGIAAECVIKAKLRELNREPTADYDGHYPRIQGILRRKLEHRGITGPWLSLARRSDLLIGWDICDRYSPDNKAGKAEFQKWSEATEELFRISKNLFNIKINSDEHSK